MYDIFEELLREKGCKAADVAKATNIHPSTFSDWKKGKSVPKQDKMLKIANFFGVPVEYLRGESSVQHDEATKIFDMNAFQTYLKTQGWDVMQDGDSYHIGNGQVSVNVSSDKYKKFESTIRNECAETILGFIADSLNKERMSLLAAHKNENPDVGEDDTPEKDQDKL